MLLAMGAVLVFAATAYAATDIYEPDDTWAQATAIGTDGVAQTRRIDPSSDVDWIKFEAEAGRPYRISVTGYPELRLYASDGTTLLGSVTATIMNKQLVHTAAQSETLYIKLNSYATYDYTISVTKIVSDAYELDDTPATATSIGTDGVAQTRRIDPSSDVDWIKFEAEAGRPYRISVTGYPELRLYASDGTTLLGSVAATIMNKQLVHTAAQSETLYIKLNSYATYDYTISVTKIVSDAYELDDTPATATSIGTDGVAQTRRIDPSSDVDWIKFEAEAGRSYLLALTGYARLYLYDSDGTTLLGSVTDTLWIKRLVYASAQTETLYIRLDSNTTYDYSIAVVDLRDEYESDDDREHARPIGSDGGAQRHALAPGDVDWVSFEADKLTSYDIRPSSAGPAIGTDAEVRLYDAAGMVLHAGGSAEFSYGAEHDATIYMRVTGAASQGVGRYLLAVAQTPEPVLFTTPVSSVAVDGTAVGSTMRKTVLVANAGGAAMDLSSLLMSSGPGFSLVGAPALPRTLAPHDWLTFDVAFSPTVPAPVGAPAFSMIFNGNPLAVVYSRYSVTLYSTYDFKNVGGAGIVPLEWAAGIYSGSATTTVAAGATYEVGAWVPTTDNWSYSGSGLFECTVGSSAWSQRFNSTAVGAGGPYLTRKPDATLTLKSTAGSRSWKLFGSAAPDSGDPTYLSIKASPVALSKYGDSTRISGTLRLSSATGKTLSGQTVHVQSSTNGKTGWKTAKMLTTSSTGYVAWSTVPRATTYYRLSYNGKNGVYAARVSWVAKVVPKPSVGAVAASRYAKRSYTLYGSLKPRHTARSTPVRVYRWRKVSGKWKAYKYLKASAYDYSGYTRYKVKYRFPYKGKWRLRAYHPADSGQAAKWSRYRYLTVK